MSTTLAVLRSLEQLLANPGDVPSYDVAALNLIAVQGLPGTESLNLPKLLDRLDSMADRVKLETARNMPRFDWMSQEPQTEMTVGDSLARYRCYCLLETLQLDCGVRYNEKRKFKPDFCQVADIFIHGILDEGGEGGTCASMPVVYVAVGRRLGYPVYLVETKGHLYFCWRCETETVIRWESPAYLLTVPPDGFNVEGSGEGIAFYPNSFYEQWPEPWKDEDFNYHQYLRPLTPKEEFASFLVQRCCCLEDLHRYEEAVKAVFNARRLCRKDPHYRSLHERISMKCVEAEVDRQKSIWRMDELRRDARMRPRIPPGKLVKVAFGKPPPDYLSPGTPVKYVRPEEADPPPPPPTDSWGMPISPAQQRMQEQNSRMLRRFDREAVAEQLLEQYTIDPIEETRSEEE